MAVLSGRRIEHQPAYQEASILTLTFTFTFAATVNATVTVEPEGYVWEGTAAVG
jgi:hypothetical protein